MKKTNASASCFIAQSAYSYSFPQARSAIARWTSARHVVNAVLLYAPSLSHISLFVPKLDSRLVVLSHRVLASSSVGLSVMRPGCGSDYRAQHMQQRGLVYTAQRSHNYTKVGTVREPTEPHTPVGRNNRA